MIASVGKRKKTARVRIQPLSAGRRDARLHLGTLAAWMPSNGPCRAPRKGEVIVGTGQHSHVGGLYSSVETGPGIVIDQLL